MLRKEITKQAKVIQLHKQGKKFAYYSKYNRKPLEGFKQVNDSIHLFKGSLWLLSG